MFLQGVIRVIAVDEQPLFQFAIQCRFKDVSGFELVALGGSFAEIEPIIQEHQPHVAILGTHTPHTSEKLVPESASIVPMLRLLRMNFPSTKILILAIRLDKSLIANLDVLSVGGYLLKQDPLTLHLPDVVRTLALGGFIYSAEVLKVKKALPEPYANGILTARQIEILNAVLRDPNGSYAQHAESVGITESTWDSHLCNIYNRLGVNNLTAAILRAVELGILSLCNNCPKGLSNRNVLNEPETYPLKTGKIKA